MANDMSYQINRYGPNSLPVTTVLKGLRDYLGEENVLYAKGCNTRDEHFPYSEQTAYPLTADEISGINEAVARAADVDVIIAVVGEDATLVGESLSRTGLNLSGRQEDLLKALHATGKPVVMVMVNGRPLTINWAAENVPAILETWFPSFRGGQAIAKTLFGEYNPGGKLTVTMPKTVGQIEYSFPFKVGSHGGQPQWSVNGGGFSRVTGHLYPFGHGLSYTTFEYSDLEIEGLRVACTVKNTGAREGDEVVQLYVSDPVSSVTTYESVLRDFERVSLAPGESKRVEFVLEEADLEILDRNMQWTVEPGEFIIKIGASSADIRLQETITWQTKR